MRGNKEEEQREVSEVEVCTSYPLPSPGRHVLREERKKRVRGGKGFKGRGRERLQNREGEKSERRREKAK